MKGHLRDKNTRIVYHTDNVARRLRRVATEPASSQCSTAGVRDRLGTGMAYEMDLSAAALPAAVSLSVAKHPALRESVRPAQSMPPGRSGLAAHRETSRPHVWQHKVPLNSSPQDNG